MEIKFENHQEVHNIYKTVRPYKITRKVNMDRKVNRFEDRVSELHHFELVKMRRNSKEDCSMSVH